MNVKHLDHLNMSVNDLDETTAWYGRVFGFEVVEDGLSQSGVPFRVLRAGDAMLCIYAQPGREHLDSAALDTRRLHGVSHYALRITDVDPLRYQTPGEPTAATGSTRRAVCART